MNNLDKHWNNLFGEYTTDETAWHGQWTTYSLKQEVIKSQQVVRSFRANLDNTVITHLNRYLDADGTVVDEKTWQIDRQTCNQPDGVVHPAMSSMRALSFGASATAWISQKLIPGKPFGGELFFRDRNWRTSAAIIYGENGQLNRIVHIREHLGCFSDETPSLETSEISGNWIGKKRSLAPDLSVSSEEETQISFDQLSGDSVSEAVATLGASAPLRLRSMSESSLRHTSQTSVSADHKMISLPQGMILMFPEMVAVDQPIQIAAGQRTADDQLKYLTVHYDAVGTFTLLISASLQQQT